LDAGVELGLEAGVSWDRHVCYPCAADESLTPSTSTLETSLEAVILPPNLSAMYSLIVIVVVVVVVVVVLLLLLLLLPLVLLVLPPGLRHSHSLSDSLHGQRDIHRQTGEHGRPIHPKLEPLHPEERDRGGARDVGGIDVARCSRDDHADDETDDDRGVAHEWGAEDLHEDDGHEGEEAEAEELRAAEAAGGVCQRNVSTHGRDYKRERLDDPRLWGIVGASRLRQTGLVLGDGGTKRSRKEPKAQIAMPVWIVCHSRKRLLRKDRRAQVEDTRQLGSLLTPIRASSPVQKARVANQ
jgi:hypothetical protein